jgi:hypothetical protein
MNRYRETNLRYGFCPFCQRRVETGKRACRVHLDAHQELLNRRRVEKGGSGICRDCSEAIKPNTMLCPSCMDKAVNRSRQYRKNKDANSLCRHCKSPALSGDILCSEHAEIRRRNVESMPEKVRAAKAHIRAATIAKNTVPCPECGRIFVRRTDRPNQCCTRSCGIKRAIQLRGQK